MGAGEVSDHVAGCDGIHPDPVPGQSLASARVMPRTPCFEAAYAGTSTPPWNRGPVRSRPVTRRDPGAVARPGESALRETEAVPSGETLDHVWSATCLYVAYDPVTGNCTISSAGHPPPLVVHASGEAEFLDVPTGPPLGRGIARYTVVERILPEGSILLLSNTALLSTGQGLCVDWAGRSTGFGEHLSYTGRTP
ncbi:PP2C family protein-serine/threonine phosphatase [Streptomyces capoamus]|uniref:PP2C family protein-serine/threonine phosphatase n=1 Tax=Streptomyces capoamus TaxID=68183 RepID=UPI003C2DDF60